MNQMFETFESRVLMSATADTLLTDKAAITSAIAEAKAALVSLDASELSLNATVLADVKANQTKSQKVANAKLKAAVLKADGIAKTKITAASSTLATLSKVGAALGVSLGKSLLAHPTKTSIEKAVTKEITALGTVIPAKESVLSTVVTNQLAAINAVYSNVEIEDPSAGSDITTGEATAATEATAFTTAAAAVETAVTQLTTDLTSI